VVRERRLGDVEDAARPAGHGDPFHQDVLDDDAEGDRDHRKIGTRDSKGSGGHTRPDQRRQDDAGCAGGPGVPAGPRDQERGAVRADRVEAGVAERHLAAESHQHVQPGGHHDQQAGAGRHVEVVGVGRDERKRRRGQGQPEPSCARHQTRRIGRAPSRPQGRTMRTRITRPKPMISRAPVER